MVLLQTDRQKAIGETAFCILDKENKPFVHQTWPF